MINANLTPYRILVGSVDVTPLIVSCVGSRSAIDRNLCFTWQFTLALADPLANVNSPSDLSPERGIWFPGTLAEIYVTDSCGNEYLFRRLRVWKISYDRNRHVAEAILRCRVGTAKGKTDPDEAATATPSDPKTRQEMILQCFEKEGIPESDIDFVPGTLDDIFDFPVVKADTPYLDTAQQLATPAQQWFWTQYDDSIRFYQWPENKDFPKLFLCRQPDLIEFSTEPDVDHLPRSIIANGTLTQINTLELKVRDLDTYAFLRDVYQIFPLAFPREKVFGNEPILYKRVRTEESGNAHQFTRVETVFVCLGALVIKVGVDRGDLGYMFLDPDLPPPFVKEDDGTTRLNPRREEGTTLVDLHVLSRRTTQEFYSDQVSIPGRVDRGDRRTIKRIEKLEQPRCVLPNHYAPFTYPPGLKHDFQVEVLTISITTTDYLARRITRETLKYGKPVDKITQYTVNGGDPKLISSTYEIQGGPPAGEEYVSLDSYDVIPPEDDPPSATFAATREIPLQAEVFIDLSSSNPFAADPETISVPFCLTEAQMRRVAENAVDQKLGQNRAVNLIMALPDHLIRNPDDLWKVIVVDNLCYLIDTPTFGFTNNQARFGCRGLLMGRLASIPTPYYGIPDYFPTGSNFEVWPIPKWTLYLGVAMNPTVWIPISNGFPPYVFTATGLPPGLTLDPQGAIYGIPTIAGNYTVTVTATDEDGMQSSRTFEIDVLALPAFLPLQSVRLTETAGVIVGGNARFVPYNGTFSYTFTLGVNVGGSGGVGVAGIVEVGGSLGFGFWGGVDVGIESNTMELGVAIEGIIGEIIELDGGIEVGGLIDYYLAATVEVSGSAFVFFT